MRTSDYDRYCVIGAGSSGLTAAKNLLQRGCAVDVLERDRDLGGNWNYDLACSRVFRSTHMISSKSFTQYPDFWMPPEFPDYPHHSQVLTYLRSYAEHFGVTRHITYNSGVERLTPLDGGRAWQVETSAGRSREYRGVVIANGHNWSPRWPSYPGEFTGEVLHSAQYKTPDIFAGRRVLVVGGGNSGCDIAVEASQNGRIAFHSTRRGYHYVPKYLFGRPSDKLGDHLAKLGVPLKLRRMLIGTLLKVVGGRPERSGLPKPDHALFETHPIVNSLLPYYVKHGAVQPKPEIERLDGERVHFTDGSSEPIDVIVYATGYNVVFPFIEKELLNWHDGRPRLFKHIFHPHYDNLFVAGLIQPDSGMFGLIDRQMQAVALFLAALRENSPLAKRLRQLKAAAELGWQGEIQYKNSPRHYFEVEHWGYAQDLEKLVAELTPAARPVARPVAAPIKPQSASNPVGQLRAA